MQEKTFQIMLNKKMIKEKHFYKVDFSDLNNKSPSIKNEFYKKQSTD